MGTAVLLYRTGFPSPLYESADLILGASLQFYGTYRYYGSAAGPNLIEARIWSFQFIDDAGFVPVLYWNSLPLQCDSRILCECI